MTTVICDSWHDNKSDVPLETTVTVTNVASFIKVTAANVTILPKMKALYIIETLPLTVIVLELMSFVTHVPGRRSTTFIRS